MEPKKEFYIVEVPVQVEQAIARPDGTPMTDKQWQAEVLNKLNMILSKL